MSDASGEPAILDLSTLQVRQRRVLVVVLSINIVTFGMMVAGSWLARSTSLFSGGLDNFGDALTYALSLAVIGKSVASQARVAMLKGILILTAALVVAGQLVYRLVEPTVPLFETMGVIGLVNLAANGLCLWLLTPYRRGDINMASAWECSRNDILEGIAVVVAAAAVYLVGAGWPDLVVALLLMVLVARSGVNVLRLARRSRP